MKKKFVAALCSLALAAAMPMAAFADISPEKVEGDTTTFEFNEDNPYFGDIDEDGNWVPIVESIVVDGAKDVTLTPGYNPDNYKAEDLEKYHDLLNQVADDKGQPMFTFEINGDVTAKDHAVLTIQLNADEWGNKVVTYYILHEDGTIQNKVVRVHADGTVRIWMESFSIVTFMDVDGITKYENLVEPQDGDLLSPKTGCC